MTGKPPWEGSLETGAKPHPMLCTGFACCTQPRPSATPWPRVFIVHTQVKSPDIVTPDEAERYKIVMNPTCTDFLLVDEWVSLKFRHFRP